MPINSPRLYRRLWPAGVAACALALAGGCRREQVTHFRVEKGIELASASAAPRATMAETPPAGGGMQGDVPPPPRPDAALAWTLPKGWSQDVAGGMRYATLKPPAAVPGKVDVSVVVLPGPAGGELANVNRWRGQIGLPPIGDAELVAARRKVRSKAGELALYDFTSEGEKKSRMVAALAEVDGSTWFLKLAGDAEPVAVARPDFLKLLESLRRGAN
jgi:hypothetical protein